MKYSLSTLYKVTDQDIFNDGAAHMIRQRRRSELKEGPSYFSPKGRCPTAIFISPEENRKFEIRKKYNYADWRTIIALGYSKYHNDLLIALQKIHDDVPARDWPKALRGLAKEFDLDAKILKGIR